MSSGHLCVIPSSGAQRFRVSFVQGEVKDVRCALASMVLAHTLNEHLCMTGAVP